MGWERRFVRVVVRVRKAETGTRKVQRVSWRTVGSAGEFEFEGDEDEDGGEEEEKPEGLEERVRSMPTSSSLIASIIRCVRRRARSSIFPVRPVASSVHDARMSFSTSSRSQNASRAERSES